MPDGRFAASLFGELQRSHTKHQDIRQTYELLTQERAIIRRRIELLRELLALEGTHIDLLSHLNS